MKDRIIANVMHKDASLAARLMANFENVENNSKAINRCLRQILNDPSIDTIECRKYLEDGLSDDEWFNQIINYVIPHLVKFKLPKD